MGIDGFDIADVEESIDFLLEGRVDFEFRTTVVSPLHTIEDIEALAQRIKGAKKFFLQNFVDSGDLIGKGMSAHDRETLDKMLAVARKYVPKTELRGV